MEDGVATKEAAVAGAGETWSDAEGYASEKSGREVEYFGWVYHLGVNSIGHEYCHLRYLVLKGTYVAMYKRDPSNHRGIVSRDEFWMRFLSYRNLLAANNLRGFGMII
ncbi:hypothetical protein BHM03_00055158 [Ensete ventricosum]|nr:hypothetical protein BHM03_00055158 [Ensete ventricosum]